MFSTSLLLYYILFVSISYLFVYRAFFHPLAKVPGPWLARVTKLWFIWQIRKGECHLLFPSLHKKYGPLVRTAPDQVAVCSEDVIKAAYGAGTAFTKGSWYRITGSPARSWRNERDLDLLNETDMNRYKKQRRAIGPAYYIAAMEKHEDILNAYIDVFTARLTGFKGEKIDLAKWTHIFALDAMANFTLSESPDCTGQGHDDGDLEASDAVWGTFTTVGLFPGIVKYVYRIPKVGALLFLLMCPALSIPIPEFWNIFKFAAPRIVGRLQGLDTGNEKGKKESLLEEEKDHLASLMKLHHDKEARFPPSWILGIAMTNFGAGHDTIMLTLSTCIYHLFTHPHILSRLHKDLSNQFLTPPSAPS